MSGTYQIWIACTENGMPIVGTACIGDRATMADCEQIYPSQMAYRCTAMAPDGITICTPTQARDAGWKIIARFPQADGSMRRGY